MMWRRLVAAMRLDGFGPAGSGVKATPKAHPGPPTENLVRAQSRQFAHVFSTCLRVPRRAPRWWWFCMAVARPPVVYDLGAGWSQLADQYGFCGAGGGAEGRQQSQYLFLNWFNPEDITRGEGEAASIAAMIQSLVQTHRLGRGAVFSLPACRQAAR